MTVPRSDRPAGGRTAKVVVSGAGTGPASFVRSVSEITVMSPAGLHDQVRAPQPTAAVEYGRISLDRDLALYLFGVCADDPVDALADVLREGLIGHVLLVDATRPDGLEQARAGLDRFRATARVPWLVAVDVDAAVDIDIDADNDADVDAVGDARLEPELERTVRDQLALASAVPVVRCDPADRESVRAALGSLLVTVLDEIDAAAVAEHA